MKHLIIAAIIITAVFAAIKLPTHAEPGQRPHAAAVLYAYDGADGQFYVGGFSISGRGTPEITIGQSLAEAIMQLQDAGLIMQQQSSPLLFTMLR